MIYLAGKPVADQLQIGIRERIHQFTKRTGRAPGLAVVLVGDDPASIIYTQRKGTVATALGIQHQTLQVPKSTSPKEVRALIHRLNEDNEIDGILIQRPLPPEFREDEVLYWISPDKDVDAFHPLNAGKLYLGLEGFRPCTAAGIVELLSFYRIPVSSKVVCIIGRSTIVGRPIANLLLQKHATVIQCHRQTPNLQKLAREADLLVVAAGKKGLIDESYLKPGAVVIDVGIHRDGNSLRGDVNHDRVLPLVSAITPVPGGVGPLTITILMQNTVLAAELRT